MEENSCMYLSQQWHSVKLFYNAGQTGRHLKKKKISFTSINEKSIIEVLETTNTGLLQCRYTMKLWRVEPETQHR